MDEEYYKLVLSSDLVAEKIFWNNDGVATEVTYKEGARIDLVVPYCDGYVGVEVEDTGWEVERTGLDQAREFAERGNAAFVAVPYQEIDQSLRNKCQEQGIGLIQIRPGNCVVVQSARFRETDRTNGNIDHFFKIKPSYFKGDYGLIYYQLLDRRPSVYDVKLFSEYQIVGKEFFEDAGSILDVWLNLMSRTGAIYYLLTLYCMLQAHSYLKLGTSEYIEEIAIDLYRSLNRAFGHIPVGQGGGVLRTGQDSRWLHAHGVAEFYENPLRMRGEESRYYRLTPWWGYLLSYSEFVTKDLGERLEGITSKFDWERYRKWRERWRQDAVKTQWKDFDKYFYKAYNSR